MTDDRIVYETERVERSVENAITEGIIPAHTRQEKDVLIEHLQTENARLQGEVNRLTGDCPKLHEMDVEEIKRLRAELLTIHGLMVKGTLLFRATGNGMIGSVEDHCNFIKRIDDVLKRNGDCTMNSS